jgi:hypothetical protein
MGPDPRKDTPNRPTAEEDGWAERTLKTALLGDFYKNPNFSGIVVRTAISAVPFFDPFLDGQDTVAWVLQVRDEGIGAWEVKLAGFLLAIGWVPTVGSVSKGVLRSVDNLDAHAAARAMMHLNAFGETGHGMKWIKEFAEKLQEYGKEAAKFMGDMLDDLVGLLQRLKAHVSPRLMAKLDDWTASIAHVRTKIDDMFTEAVEHYKKKLDDAIATFKKEDWDLDVSTRDEALRVQNAVPVYGASDAARAIPPQASDDLVRKQMRELPVAGDGVTGPRYASGLGVMDEADPNWGGFAQASHRREGWFDVARHGTEPGEAGGFRLFKRDASGKIIETYSVTPEQAAAVIKDSGWKQSQPIRLYTCRAGVPDVDGVAPAQKLSDLLHTEVIATNKPNINVPGGYAAFTPAEKGADVYTIFTPKSGSTLKPLAETKEIASGTAEWSRKYIKMAADPVQEEVLPAAAGKAGAVAAGEVKDAFNAGKDTLSKSVWETMERNK